MSCSYFLPAIPGECTSNRNVLSAKFRYSFARSSCKRSSRSLPPDVDPGLCCNDVLLGTGECVPKDMSESDVSDNAGDSPGSGRRDGNDVAPELDNGG